jgi:predicted permease
MRALDALKRQLRSLIFKSREDRQLARELQFHLDQQIAENTSRGMSPEAARRAALRTIGGMEQVGEQCRDARGLHWLETTLQDLRYAVRSLRKTPGFTLVAVLTLALGVGANTAIFSLIDSLLLTALPVKNPQQLFFIRTTPVKVGAFQVSRALTHGDLDALQRAEHLQGIAAVQPVERASLAVNGGTRLTNVEFVTGMYFDTLGLRAWHGRTLDARDDTATGTSGQGWPAMISYGYWQRSFGGDPEIVGKRISLNTVPATIVGVEPPGFRGMQLDEVADIALPFAAMLQVEQGNPGAGLPEKDRGVTTIIARLKAGASTKAAEAELTVLLRAAELAADPRDALSVERLTVEMSQATHGNSNLRRQFSDALLVLMGVVGAVMLIACANIAGLLLARGSARQREIAIRLSLGSSRSRIVRQLLTENLLLSVLGGALGILFAAAARATILSVASRRSLADLNSIPLDWRTIAFVTGACLLNAILFGAAPALQTRRIGSADVLRSGAAASNSSRLPFGRVLVGSQIAVCLMLVVAAGLFLGTLRNLYRIELGFNQEHLLMANVDPHLVGVEEKRNADLYQRILSEVERLPGVTSATLSNNRLLTGRAYLTDARVPGYTPPPGENLTNHWTVTYNVGPRFFETLQMPLIGGRDFTASDKEGAPPVAVVNETFAKHYFGGRSPVGQKIEYRSQKKQVEIVGVAKDSHYFSVRDDKQDVIFTPMFQLDSGKVAPEETVVLRTTADPSQAANDLRTAIGRVDPALPVFDVNTMDTAIADNVSRERLLAILSSFFGVLALALCAIGLYGVLAYGVTRRTAEIGVRIALGATRERILRLILSETGYVLGAGLLAGTALAWAASRLLRTLLFGVSTHDLTAFLGALAVLAIVGLAAAALPARRAMSVNPTAALRYE